MRVLTRLDSDMSSSMTASGLIRIMADCFGIKGVRDDAVGPLLAQGLYTRLTRCHAHSLLAGS